MRHVILNCGVPPLQAAESHSLSAIPTRTELKIINTICKEVLPEDPTPSLDEIAASPNVAHLGAPGPAPQLIDDPLRLIVHGTDAALAAVLTRLMRIDALWAEVAFIPSEESTVAQAWGLPKEKEFAFEAPVKPKPLIRDDAGQAVAHSATISDWDGREITGEIIVDDTVLLHHSARTRNPRKGQYGARLISTFDAPGIEGNRILSSEHPGGFWQKVLPVAPSLIDATAHQGRAMQAGGVNLRITIDGQSRKRPVERATFYRHLRDLQAVRA
ncbi:hypothetical protein [Corynebacterium gerontici]|nr:hypothetical protein [Corynebacterium gerontici]